MRSFGICLCHQLLFMRSSKDRWDAWGMCTLWGRCENHRGFLWREMKERSHLKDPRYRSGGHARTRAHTHTHTDWLKITRLRTGEREMASSCKCSTTPLGSVNTQGIWTATEMLPSHMHCSTSQVFYVLLNESINFNLNKIFFLVLSHIGFFCQLLQCSLQNICACFHLRILYTSTCWW